MKNYKNYIKINESIIDLFDNIYNRPSSIKGLVSTGFDINTLDENGATLLHKLSEWVTNVREMKMFLEIPNINLNIIDNSGYNPAYYFTQQYNDEIVELFLDRKDLDVNQIIKKEFTTAFLVARSVNSENLTKLLTNFDVDLSIKLKGKMFFDFIQKEELKEIMPIIEKNPKYKQAYKQYLLNKDLDKFNI